MAAYPSAYGHASAYASTSHLTPIHQLPFSTNVKTDWRPVYTEPTSEYAYHKQNSHHAEGNIQINLNNRTGQRAQDFTGQLVEAHLTFCNPAFLLCLPTPAPQQGLARNHSLPIAYAPAGLAASAKPTRPM
jgi:hypothetical protein